MHVKGYLMDIENLINFDKSLNKVVTVCDSKHVIKNHKIDKI